MKHYENLANCIILYAVNDYRKALRGESYADHIAPEDIIVDCEAFFLSDYFRVLTKLDGQYLIRKLRREAKDESNINSANTATNRIYHSNSIYMLR